MSAIAVVGSLNIDLVIRASHCPIQGETVIGSSFGMAGGGKGSNQALAAARLNAKSYMIGCVGNDDFGRKLRTVLNDNGVDCSHLETRKEAATGTAVITVTDEGESSIVLTQGANSLLTSDAIFGAKKNFREFRLCIVPDGKPGKNRSIRIKTRKTVRVQNISFSRTSFFIAQ